jgi:hypothetical protein
MKMVKYFTNKSCKFTAIARDHENVGWALLALSTSLLSYTACSLSFETKNILNIPLDAACNTSANCCTAAADMKTANILIA